MSTVDDRIREALIAVGDAYLRRAPADHAALRARVGRLRRRRRFQAAAAAGVAAAAAVTFVLAAPWRSGPVLRKSVPAGPSAPFVSEGVSLPSAVSMPSGVRVAFGRVWVTDRGVLSGLSPDGGGKAMVAEPGGVLGDIAASHPKLFALDSAGRRIVVFDPVTRAVEEIALNAAVGPKADINVDAADDSVLWASLPASDRLVRIDVAAARVTLDTHVRGVGRLGVDPGSVWVAARNGRALLHLDPASGDVLRSLPLGRGTVTDLAIDDDVWIAKSDGRIIRMDPLTGKVLAQARVGRDPVIHPVADELWVAYEVNDRGAARPLDKDTLAFAADPVLMAGAPADLAVGKGAVWVAIENQPGLVKVE